jgi:phage terminase large subunit-like protein
MFDTACPDWKERIVERRSLVPDLPLFGEEADKALRIFKRLMIPDVIGTPTMAEAAGEWFFPIVAAIFGSFDVAANRRMIQEFFLLVPKKNGKSSYAAAIMVVAIIINRRPDAEFLLIAPTKEVADIAYKQATGIIRLDPELTKLFHVQRNHRTITHRETGARIQIKAADADVITGSKSTGILVDETHVFAKKTNATEIFVEIRGAMAARPDGFMIQISTQSKSAPSGVFASELGTARAVRDGTLKLPLLPILYELPEGLAKDGGWKDAKTWPMVNPNLGLSVNEEFLARELLKAEREGIAQLTLFASQHFNVQIGLSLSVDGWAGAAVWDRGFEKGLTLDVLLDRSEIVTVGIDGGGLDDLLGIGVIGREKDTKCWLSWTHALISPEGIERRKANAQQYSDFQKDGDLTLVDQLPDDITFVVDIVKKIKDRGLLAQVGVDAAGIGGIVDALAEIGISQDEEKLGAVRQGIALMGAIKTIERKLADGSFRHGGQRLMAWCASNARVVPTPTAMRIARDEAGYGKVDPLMALFNSASLMSMNPAQDVGRALNHAILARGGFA